MTMKKEVWKDVKDYEGVYEISSHGRVKSLERKVKHSKGGYRMVKEIILKYGLRYGYPSVILSSKGKLKNRTIHQLMAIEFKGYIPGSVNDAGERLVVDHDDNNKLNNHESNIKIITHRENLSKDKKGGSSKYVGVSWYKPLKKWRSCIGISGKLKHLGYFDCELEASKVYQNKLEGLKLEKK